MQIWFDLDFDGGCWPGPLASRAASAGEAWLGPSGLLALLETQLGLAGPAVSEGLRAARLVPRFPSIHGFWDESAVVDPLATARRLLEWRDLLCMAGWKGRGKASRLAALSNLTRDLPGSPDRIDAATTTLPRREVDLEAVHLFEDRGELAPLWQKLLTALEARGVKVLPAAPTAPLQTGDLKACQASGFSPKSDGSLQLLRSQGPLSSAVEVAAWLAAGQWQDTVIIGGDVALERAFKRFGLPALGATSGTGANSILEVLPLTIALGWDPPDPARALELLTLPTSPVPHGIAFRLVGALKEWPAVDSDLWREKLQKGLAVVEEDRRADVSARLDVLLKPCVKTDRYPLSEIARRVLVVERWMRGNMMYDKDSRAAWQGGLAQCAALSELAAATGLPDFSPAQLGRLLEESTSAAPPVQFYSAEAGVHLMPAPGAVAGPARRIVWWNFTRDSAPGVSALPLSPDEKEELASQGVRLPDPRVQAEAISRRWRRPLINAQEHLLLVCPRFNESNSEDHPHPLWDEITANAAEGSDARRLVLTTLVGRKRIMKKADFIEAPKPITTWKLPRGFKPVPREVESPSGAMSLAACPFQWSMHYLCDLYEAESSTLSPTERLVGKLAHEIIARILRKNNTSPEEAEKEAQRMFDVEGPRLAATLFMRGNEELQSRARLVTSLSAKAIASYLKEAGLVVLGAEKEGTMDALGTHFKGHADLLAGRAGAGPEAAPEAIIDMKFGSEKFHREELKNGAACQLASYARIFAKEGVRPQVAYFILQTRRLHSTTRGPLKNVALAEGPSSQETWAAFEALYKKRWEAIAGGTIESTYAEDENGKLQPAQSRLLEGELLLTPPCKYCGFGLLCGRTQEVT